MPATEDYLRPLPKMHRWFAVTMVILFGATLLMIYADHHDEWRDYQKQFYKLDADKIVAEELKRKSELGGDPQGFAKKLEELNAAREQKKNELGQKVSNLSDLEREVKRLVNEYNLQMRKVREKRAFRDVARADFDLGVRDQLPEHELEKRKTDFDVMQQEVVELETELDRRDAARNEAAAKLKDKTKDYDVAVAAIKTFEADITRLDKAHNRIAPRDPFMAIKRTIMEWPIIDGFNSHMKVQQDWLPDIKQTLGMAKTARFDRCRTCHLGIDRTEAGDVPSFPHGDGEGEYSHPFSTHPRLDVYMTAASPHPLPEFGCTSCHEGQGSGTSFQNASHAPNDPHQAEEWEHKYKWFNNHFWESPMMPKRLRESACLKCHHSVVELGQNTKFSATAPQVYEGWKLIQKYGCFGCHDINGFDAGKSVGPDLRLEPQTAEEAKKITDDPKAVAGTMRKVGPSLRHIASKTTPEWLAYWTEEPKRFRPTTTMPQFFKLSNQDDAHGEKFSKVELAALAHYFFDKAQPLNLEKPQDGYQPNADRGKLFFAQKGCLACHSHDDARFKGSHADFGPDLSKVHAKIKPGADGFNWVYTWIREPTRHHARTRMPDLFLDPEGKDDTYVDPAADIAAFLLRVEAKSEPYPSIQVDDSDVDELVELLLARRKTVTPAQAKQVMQTREYPIARENVKGDEIELVPEKADAEISDEDWRRRKMNYLGRVTISRYGCYGCHDIPNFEAARPIGTALQDWGLKDPSRLAPEHIEEYLQHHGEPDGSSTSSTAQRIATALTKARSDSFDNHEQEERELSAAYFYENLLHHGRAGFIWQKLRDPRSYDYQKTSTKFYDERLRMPKFPLNEKEIEAISTFVLGLIARPPAEKYQYRPKGAELAKVEGEKLLQKYNCVGCHVIDLPEIAYGEKLDDVQASVLETRDHEAGRDLLLKLKPPRKGLTKQVKEVKTADSVEKLPVIAFRGLMASRPDPDDDPADQAYGYDLWETLDVNGKVLFPGERITVGVLKLVSRTPARGGHFAEWLVEDLLKLNKENNAWQMSPPPLYLEGIKVQTPWLYQFLKNPYQIRHTTVLRMPKFNMSDAEALALANYFAAYDGAPYPYQNVPQRQPVYLAEMNAKYHEKHPQRPGDYLQESWRVLNAPLCIKCHSLGGREVKVSDPKKDIRGPNLDQVSDRLQPDWMLLWFYKPRWITPYTSMPAPFAKDKQDYLPLLDGDAGDQTIAVRDVLANYLRLMEREGKLADTATVAAPAVDAKPNENNK